MSGHWAQYREDMFPPLDLGSEQLLLRPSLCPHHAVIYRSCQHSYRELPLRLAELREEASGVLGGLTRVRAMQLNDAHIFCQPEQVGAEVGAVLDLIEHAYGAVGITLIAIGSHCAEAQTSMSTTPRCGTWARRRLPRYSTNVAWPTTQPSARALSTARRSTFRSWTKQAASQPCRLFSSTSISPGSST